MGELVERAGHRADGQPPVAEVEVVQAQGADGFRAGRVNRGQGERNPGCRCGRGLGCVMDLVGGPKGE